MRTDETPNGVAIEFYHPREHPHCLIHRINDGARDALVDDFRNGTLGAALESAAELASIFSASMI
jgi:hypothetical protein